MASFHSTQTYNPPVMTVDMEYGYAAKHLTYNYDAGTKSFHYAIDGSTGFGRELGQVHIDRAWPGKNSTVHIKELGVYTEHGSTFIPITRSASGDLSIDPRYGSGDSDLYLITQVVGNNSNQTFYGNNYVRVQTNAGNDLIGGAKYQNQFGIADTFFGMGGNDLMFGRAGNDILDGGAGNDTILGGLDNDQIAGGSGDDTLKGEGGHDIIHGGAGNDYVEGGSGNDTMTGGSGNDSMFGVSGNNDMDGGWGNDQLFGGSNADTLHGGADNDTVKGGRGNDLAYGDAGADIVTGDAGSDTLYGGAGNDTVYGGEGSDVVDGGDNNDVLIGGNGSDKLYGGNGNDTLYSGDRDSPYSDLFANNELWGGTGADKFIINGGKNNRITDFTLGEGDTLSIDGSLYGISQTTDINWRYDTHHNTMIGSVNGAGDIVEISSTSSSDFSQMFQSDMHSAGDWLAII